MKRTDMKMRIKRAIVFLNLMNETIRRGDRLRSSARAKQCGVSNVVFQKAKELGVFKRDDSGRLLPRPRAICAPTAIKVIRATDAYAQEASKKKSQKNVSSPAPTPQPTLDFAAPESETPKPPVGDKITDTINRLRDAGVKSAVMFVVEL